MKENKNETSERQKLWTSLKDYGLIMRETLERELQTGLLCKHCVREFFASNKSDSATCINLDDSELHVTTTTSAFACLVQVTCRRGKHGFVVEPPRRNMKKEEKESDKSKTDEKKKMNHPEKTYRIRDYSVNYLAFLLTQIMGNGVTSLDTMMGMFGLGAHSGSHREWTYIARELGKAEQKRADKIQYQNILT